MIRVKSGGTITHPPCMTDRQMGATPMIAIHSGQKETKCQEVESRVI